jgi:phage-related protein
MAEKRDTIAARVARLEKSNAELADTVKILLDAQIHTEKRFDEVGKRFDEVGKRFEEMGERIGTLVSAIGELITRMPPLPPPNLTQSNPRGRR